MHKLFYSLCIKKVVTESEAPASAGAYSYNEVFQGGLIASLLSQEFGLLIIRKDNYYTCRSAVMSAVEKADLVQNGNADVKQNDQPVTLKELVTYKDYESITFVQVYR